MASLHLLAVQVVICCGGLVVWRTGRCIERMILHCERLQEWCRHED